MNIIDNIHKLFRKKTYTFTLNKETVDIFEKCKFMFGTISSAKTFKLMLVIMKIIYENQKDGKITIMSKDNKKISIQLFTGE